MHFYTNVALWGNNLLLREYKDGERINRRVKYSPTLFCPVAKETGYKTLQGKNVAPVKHDTMRDAREWVNNYKDQPHLIYGNTMYQYSYLSDTYKGIIDWDIEKLLVFTIDIEVACENGFPSPEEAIEPMLSITIKNHQNKQILVWGIGDYHTDRDDVTYVNCDGEVHLLKEFLSFWENNCPDIVTGWNTEFFDIPYICNRIKNVFGEDEVKRLSPWKSVTGKEIFKMGHKQQLYDILGVGMLDYYDLYRKYTYTNQESYRLDHIAFVELGERKDDNPYETFKDWYTKDYQSFIDYNIQDVEIVDKLEDKMRLIELCLTMAYDAKVNYMDVLGSVKYWDILIYNYLKEKHIVIPQKISSEKSEQFIGAYVKEPQVGAHDWVVSFDLNSLYPHLIMQYNISPETLVSNNEKVPGMSIDKLLNKEVDTSILNGVTLTPNGALFTTDKKGFLPELMETMYSDRVKYKKLMIEAKKEYERTKDKRLLKDISRYNNIQMAKKISLNSAYGAIGNNWFRYFNILTAEAITTSGQLSIRWIEQSVNGYLNKILGTNDTDYVIASDTDSIYLRLEGLVRKIYDKGEGIPNDDATRLKIVDFLDRVATEKIEPFIDKSYQDLADYLNAYDQKMFMKREVIADKGIWTAKKRYILNCWDIEGVRYDEPKLKMMGIEAVKSSTPAPCRDKIKGAMKILMTGTQKELNTFIQDFREEFMKLPPESIAYPRSVNGLNKWTESSTLFKKGAPIHVKGAILYNHILKQNKLTHKYPIINNGEKIKFLHLKSPNIYQSTSISFLTQLPSELSLDKMVDYEVQFDRSFVEPLRVITDKINMIIDDTYGQQSTLEDFFG
jgi:DNA polymerase elongation subunit (family B)